MKTKYIIYILLAILIGALVYNKFFSARAKKRDASTVTGKGGKKGGRNGPVPVRLLIARDTTLDTRIDVTGTLDANEKVNLISETAGNITGIYFQEGSYVKKGQLLVKVYNQDQVASLKQNEYQIALAKQNEYRNKILLQKEAISQQEYDTSLTSLNTLKAASDVLKAQISKTEIRAPFSGTIGLRNISPGGYLSPNTSIASLVNMDPAKLTFAVPEKYLPLLTTGTKVVFNVSSSNQNFKAVVYAIEPSIDLNSRTITVRAKADNPKGVLKAGSFAKVNIQLNQVPNTIMLPTECVVPDLKSSVVYVYHNGLAVARPVKTDVRTETRVEITSGIKAGDSVVVSGIIQMRPKVPLKVVKVIK
jgi:membrane fusion protein (multidrug efflux system)